MEAKARIDSACQFLLQSPPGEINDVLNDVRNIISDDDLLQEGVLPVLRRYNVEQFTVVDVPGTDHQSIISDAARSKDTEEGVERYIDPKSKTSFVFDHLTLEASDPQPYEPSEEPEEQRAALEKSTQEYLVAHYHDGVASVFSTADSKQFVIQVVANKYNPTNYWSGRWRSEYRVNFSGNTLEGKILANVHYYEQGNVQLSTTHNVSLKLPPAISSSGAAASASKILALIGDEEGRYQSSLNDLYGEMGEKTFKGLRRALPLTRQKLDWDRVLGYKIGAELSAGKGGFGGES